MENKIFKIAIFGFSLSLLVMPFLAGANASPKITICHATGSSVNPYTRITVSQNALNGHSNHPNDIIPAPAEGCPSNATAPTLTFTADQMGIFSGDPVTLSWSSTNTTTCVASNDVSDPNWTGAKSTSGSIVVMPVVDTVYSLSCVGTNSATLSANILITVISPSIF